MDQFYIWDTDLRDDKARLLYTSAPSLPQLGLSDWQQYVYVVEMTPDGQATQTMVASRQAQDHIALALRRGHDVTLFNRGRTNKKLFPDLVTLIGDRNNALDSLKGGSWDAVIDNSGYIPRLVADSARLLASAASHYVYTSTI